MRGGVGEHNDRSPHQSTEAVVLFSRGLDRIKFAVRVYSKALQITVGHACALSSVDRGAWVVGVKNGCKSLLKGSKKYIKGNAVSGRLALECSTVLYIIKYIGGANPKGNW